MPTDTLHDTDKELLKLFTEAVHQDIKEKWFTAARWNVDDEEIYYITPKYILKLPITEADKDVKAGQKAPMRPLWKGMKVPSLHPVDSISKIIPEKKIATLPGEVPEDVTGFVCVPDITSPAAPGVYWINAQRQGLSHAELVMLGKVWTDMEGLQCMHTVPVNAYTFPPLFDDLLKEQTANRAVKLHIGRLLARPFPIVAAVGVAGYLYGTMCSLTSLESVPKSYMIEGTVYEPFGICKDAVGYEKLIQKKGKKMKVKLPGAISSLKALSAKVPETPAAAEPTETTEEQQDPSVTMEDVEAVTEEAKIPAPVVVPAAEQSVEEAPTDAVAVEEQSEEEPAKRTRRRREPVKLDKNLAESADYFAAPIAEFDIETFPQYMREISTLLTAISRHVNNVCSFVASAYEDKLKAAESSKQEGSKETDKKNEALEQILNALKKAGTLK